VWLLAAGNTRWLRRTRSVERELADVGVAGAEHVSRTRSLLLSRNGNGRFLDAQGLPVATQDTITQLAECLLRRADRYRPREFGLHESDGSPDEKEGRPKHEPRGYQACMMRSEMWPRRQESISGLTQAHRAVPS
jgi:hypothetical protein